MPRIIRKAHLARVTLDDLDRLQLKAPAHVHVMQLPDPVRQGPVQVRRKRQGVVIVHPVAVFDDPHRLGGGHPFFPVFIID